MARATLIVNPFATRVSDQKLAQVERELARVAELTVRHTEHRLHATELVAEACRDHADAIVVFSGDGGFNEALNGVEGDVPLGFLPGGGTSVLSRALGLPVDPVAAARRLAQSIELGRTRRITVGRVNGRRFGFCAGLGLDAEAVRRVDRMGRRGDGKRPGDLAFALAVVRTVAARRGRIEPTLEVDGLGRAAFALVANTSPYTYLKRVPLAIAPDADFGLGLDIVAPVSIRRRSLVPATYSLLSGHPHARNVLYTHDVDRIRVVCDRPTAMQADGEDLGDVEEAVFEAERAAVSVLA